MLKAVFMSSWEDREDTASEVAVEDGERLRFFALCRGKVDELQVDASWPRTASDAVAWCARTHLRVWALTVPSVEDAKKRLGRPMDSNDEEF